MDMCPAKYQELVEENQWLQQELSEESAIRLAEEQTLTNLVSSIYEVENELSLDGRSAGNLRKVLSKLIKQTCQASTLSGCSSAVIKAILVIYSNQLENQFRIENPPDFLMWFDEGTESNQRDNLKRTIESTDIYGNSFLDSYPPTHLEGRMSRLGVVEEVDEEELDCLSDDDVPEDATFQIKCLLDEMINQIEKEEGEDSTPGIESHRKSSADSAMSSGESSTCLLPLKLCLESNYRNVFVQADLIPSNITDELAKLTQEMQLQSNELLLAKRRIEELTYLVTIKKSAVLQDDLEAWKELVRHQKTLLVKMTNELEMTQQQLAHCRKSPETSDFGVQVDFEDFYLTVREV